MNNEVEYYICTSRFDRFSCCSLIASAYESGAGQFPVQKSGELGSLCSIHASTKHNSVPFSSLTCSHPQSVCVSLIRSTSSWRV